MPETPCQPTACNKGPLSLTQGLYGTDKVGHGRSSCVKKFYVSFRKSAQNSKGDPLCRKLVVVVSTTATATRSGGAVVIC